MSTQAGARRHGLKRLRLSCAVTCGAYTQRQVAKRCGLSDDAYSRIERTGIMSPRSAFRLAKLWKVSMDDLMHAAAESEGFARKKYGLNGHVTQTEMVQPSRRRK